jgi:GNAT superfamily N-acetyltransferase
MKATLHTFFQRTALSRDANEFLLKYYSFESDQFLLMIPVLRSNEALQDFCAEVEYLLQLELFPAFLLSNHFVDTPFRQQLIQKFSGGETALKIIECRESDFLVTLISLADEVGFYKFMWTGGSMRDSQGKIIGKVHLNNSRQLWSDESQEVLAWAKPFLTHLGPAHSLQLVNPQQILPELFTFNGAGTLMSLGYRFSMDSLVKANRNQLTELIEKGFGRKLQPQYFEELHPATKILMEEGASGAIVMEPWEDIHYLDKVVVRPEFYGRGLGSLLLDELTQQMVDLSLKRPKLCWRARPDNPYLSRYAALVYGFAEHCPLQCGTLADGHYVYHYIGLNDVERLWVLERMQKRASSFVAESLSPA